MPEPVSPQIVIAYRTRRGIHVYDTAYDTEDATAAVKRCRALHPGCNTAASMAGNVPLSEVAPIGDMDDLDV